MTQLILIRAAETDWQAQGRLAGDTDLQLNEIGHRQATATADNVAGFMPQAVHCGADQATRQTATIIADVLQLKARTADDLREMDLGHWEGLTVADFRERFSKVYRLWREDPLAVEPPEGESVSDVAERLEKCLGRILKRSDDQTVALVLGRFAYAVARCRLVDREYTCFWQYIEGDEPCHVFDYGGPAQETTRTADKSRIG
ncbi:MAG: histidine phosphatase family protein [Phycisphaerae bacterium]